MAQRMKESLQSTGLSEAEAILRAQQCNSGGFERLYSLHSRRVYSLCLRMVANPTEAEDLTQDAFLQLFRKIHTFRGESGFSTWLHRLTVNVVLMHFRRRKHAELSLDESRDTANETAKPPIDVATQDLRLNGLIDRVNLGRALNQLPNGYRQMFLLHDVEGYEHNEIAELLGCSVGNSKSQLHKARLKLRQLLHEQARNQARQKRESTDRTTVAAACATSEPPPERGAAAVAPRGMLAGSPGYSRGLRRRYSFVYAKA